MRDRCKALYMGTKYLGEGLRFSFAEFGILSSDVRNRTMMLAKLMSQPLSVHACGIPIFGKELRQCRNALTLSSRNSPNASAGSPLEVLSAIASEVRYRRILRRSGHESNRHESQIVIGVFKLLATTIGHDEDLRRSPSTPTCDTSKMRFTSFKDAFDYQGIEVSTHSRCRDLEFARQLRSGSRAAF